MKYNFQDEAEKILALKVKSRVNSHGGYGPTGEVIYEKHPSGCPSTLMTSRSNSKAVFMTNGSVLFEVKTKEGMDITVLAGSFDSNEKHEINTPSSNIWFSLGSGKKEQITSLINPGCNINCAPVSMKIVKLGDPERAMWYSFDFSPEPGVVFSTAVKYMFTETACGPAVIRQAYVKNRGKKALKGSLWAYYNLQGTQKFVYNKPLWYDAGLAVLPGETVVSCRVPYTDILQIKRVSGRASGGIKTTEASCDYTGFIGDISAFSLLPQAVKKGKFLNYSGDRLNRFSVPTISAFRCAVDIAPGKSGVFEQSLQYLTEQGVIADFRNKSACSFPGYKHVEKAFAAAGRKLIKNTPDAGALINESRRAAVLSRPAFEIAMPNSGVVTEYARSVWTGVQELYENCRAHGAMLADGIELGTRDRGQDMWPKMKENAARVREDLLHALSFRYVTVKKWHKWSSPMTRTEKLHGMFPRQFPSRWNDRSKAVMNDNRPYNDSAVWLLNSLTKYLSETGDIGILGEKVWCVRLTNPDKPEQSGIAGLEESITIAETILEILECYGRQAKDSPYGMVQMMYGDWCDPVDMIGTSIPGDASTRGMGRGVSVRLSAHVFNSMVEAIDFIGSAEFLKTASGEFKSRLDLLKNTADTLRKNIVRIGWESGKPGAFLDAIHELKKDGAKPDYNAGETGYTIGSIKAREFDGIKRRELLTQAHCIPMLLKERAYLEPVKNGTAMLKELLQTADSALYDKELGFKLFSPPISNDENSLRLVGRMGMIPAGTAENGEYHHAQLMMHFFRVQLQGEADKAWSQFKAVISATRNESLGGPFDMPSTSYASDTDDPHYGKGMYFGLSGSTDWIIEFFQEIAGVKLALHDQNSPDIEVSPRLPAELKGELVFRRLIHRAGKKGFEIIPFELNVHSGTGRTEKIRSIKVNGKPSGKAVIASLEGFKAVEMEICYI